MAVYMTKSIIVDVFLYKRLSTKARVSNLKNSYLSLYNQAVIIILYNVSESLYPQH